MCHCYLTELLLCRCCWCCFVGGFAVVVVAIGVVVVAVVDDDCDCDCLDWSFGGAVVVAAVVGCWLLIAVVDECFVAGDDCLIAVVVDDCLFVVAAVAVVDANYCTN